jgi:hypothetical protein
MIKSPPSDGMGTGKPGIPHWAENDRTVDLHAKATNQMYYEDLKICESQGIPIFMGVAVDSVMMASLCRT